MNAPESPNRRVLTKLQINLHVLSRMRLKPRGCHSFDDLHVKEATLLCFQLRPQTLRSIRARSFVYLTRGQCFVSFVTLAKGRVTLRLEPNSL